MPLGPAKKMYGKKGKGKKRKFLSALKKGKKRK